MVAKEALGSTLHVFGGCQFYSKIEGKAKMNEQIITQNKYFQLK